MNGQNHRKALHPIRRRIAADPEIHHPIPVSGGVEQPLQVVGKALPRLHPESGGKTIAERRDHRARIFNLLDFLLELLFASLEVLLEFMLEILLEWLLWRPITAGSQCNRQSYPKHQSE